MEAADLSNPNQQTTAADRKHAALLERLSNRKPPTSLLSPSPNSSPLESTQSFLSLFSQSKLSIDYHLSRLLLLQSTDPKSDLENVSLSIVDLEKLVAENSYFLPSFEIRTCLQTLSSLKQTLENVSSQIRPKKKFAFKSKKASSGSINPIEPQTPVAEPEKRTVNVRDSPGFRDRENEVLVKEFRGSEMGEFSISDLNSCEVRLIGCFRALFIHRLRNCKVYTGPVLGSVLIEDVEGCVFVLASHQIRIHHAKESDFYLRVRSRPIIEDCSGVRFAPYCLSYEGIERDLKESNLDEETGNWENVDDFRWLKAIQSPNWSILPENERVGRVILSNLDK